MRRHRIVRGRHLAGEPTRGQTFRLMPDEQPEHLETRVLRQSRHDEDCTFTVHVSRIVDNKVFVKNF